MGIQIRFLCCLTALCAGAACLPTATPSPVAAETTNRPAASAAIGTRRDEKGLAVVHLRGTPAEMDRQYHQLLEAEIAGFDQALAGHRGMRPYVGGCSNLAAFGAASVDGSLWHGRNFDLSGHGLLDEYRVVYILEPEGRIPYVTISWPGTGAWGYHGVHTAMNARGLSLGYMISYAAGESDRGTPALWALFGEVMERAGTIEEALALLRASPRRTAANVLLAQGDPPRAVVVEMTSSALVVRQARNGAIHATNHFVSDDLFYSENKDPDSLARYERLETLMQEGLGAFDLTRTALALRDRFDIHTRLKTPEGDVIGSPLTMLSVVFHPADLRFWVARGPAPAAYNEFVGFDLAAELDGEGAQAHVPGIPADLTLTENERAEIEAYQQGRRLFDAGEDEAAARLFAQALTLRPESPRYGYGLAGALINLGRDREAIAALETALTGDPGSVYLAYIYYRLGTIYERSGATELMGEAFRRVLELDVGDPQIEEHARLALGE